MYELEKNNEVNRLIAITKSDSGISGPKLAQAHIELGRLLGEKINGLNPDDTTIVAMLRGGIFLQRACILPWDVSFRYMIQSMKHLSDRKQKI